MIKNIKIALFLSIPFSILAVLAIQAVTMTSITFSEEGRQILQKGVSAMVETINSSGFLTYVQVSLSQYIVVFIIVFTAMVTFSLFSKRI